MSLSDATKKMSKSLQQANGRIDILDDKESIFKKIKQAKTDSIAGITYDKERRPEVSNLIDIFSACSGRSVESIVEEFKSVQSTAAFKERLSVEVANVVLPIGAKIRQLQSNPTQIDKVLELGRQKAIKIAEKNLSELHKLVGLYH